ncbi:putative beta-lysine N-acetyltransferase [Cohnella pontilimi]|uniref:Putative beta-lysine N-acetyltransferase n=1 Tax=Cohnella pontilimi TaxID=2564100 RepID=A0A4U0F8S1_9BACL|nr:putative beta-lysine N-acetyltransferase [Cohnella pontilimi]TJY41077.1 putative beta-lysine N-acetyltransferase [Cohnella pontilimi]
MPDVKAYFENVVETESAFTLHICLDYFNRRLRVDDYRGDVDAICKRAADIASSHAFTKIFVKSREEDWPDFLSRGYMLEGIYKAYFNGRDAFCMALYFDLNRRTSDYWMEEDDILRQVLEMPPKPEQSTALPQNFTLRAAALEDAERLAVLYRHVFPRYPTPMDDAAYIEKVIGDGTIFYVSEHENSLVSAASAEINRVYRNAEITDCATLAEFRRHGMMRLLIRALEDDLRSRGIHCAYSLSRALSFGMNASLFQLGYRYCGRLTKNCDIYDKFEDMNLWVKVLPGSVPSTDGG